MRKKATAKKEIFEANLFQNPLKRDRQLVTSDFICFVCDIVISLLNYFISLIFFFSSLHIRTMSNNNNNRITIGQYNIISTIGTGSFGKVKCKPLYVIFPRSHSHF
jgi:ABC-type uncharacterized transport system fused permease/ATPase subunit